MSYFSRYQPGEWLTLCDICGRKFVASSLIKRWDGLMCCSQDWETRQPQDFVKAKADQMGTPWSRPEPQNQFILIPYPNKSLGKKVLGKITLG